MAGHTYLDDFVDDESSPNSLFSNFEEVSIHPQTFKSLSSTLHLSYPSKTKDQDALITASPRLLELRQNNPQDCSNLIIASVDRATVEISRTIIALNATFSQQLQAASISASNGIKSAQNSASSTINVVVQSASVATVAAFSSVTVANRAVTSANLALTDAQSSASTALSVANQSIASATSSLVLVNLALGSAQANITSVSSASSSDVSRLSASLTLLQASVLSVQSSASSAIAAAQSALASVTGSAAAQASAILASATQSMGSVQTAVVGPSTNGQPLAIQSLSITPVQAALIAVGSFIAFILLGFTIYFLIVKMRKRKGHDSYLDEKNFPTSPQKLPSRLSSTTRTGNGMTIKFNPPKSSDAPPPGRSVLRQQKERSSVSPSVKSLQSLNIESADVRQVNDAMISPDPATWPLTLDLTIPKAESSFNREWWPLNEDIVVFDPKVVENGQSQDIIQTAATSTIQNNASESMQTAPHREDSWNLVNEKTNVNEPEQDQGGFIFEEVESTNLTLNPFDDPIQKFPIQDDFLESTEVHASIPDAKQVVDEIPLTNPFNDPPDALVDSTSSQTVEEAVDNKLSTAENAIKSDDEKLFFHIDQILPQKSSRVPKPEVLALLREDDQPRTSTVPEIDTLLRMVAQQNEETAHKPLFWSDFRAPDPEVEEALSLTPLKDRSSANERLLPSLDLRDSALTERENQTPLPKSPDTVVEAFEVDHEPSSISSEPLQAPPTTVPLEPPQMPLAVAPDIERSISPLRRNPQIRNIASMLAENNATSAPETEEPELKPESTDNERGRSMIRTSDIIEARISYINRSKEVEKNTEQETLNESQRNNSPLSKKPADASTTRQDLDDRTLSPLQRNPSTARVVKRKSRTVSPPKLSRLNPREVGDRNESPLRRNPVDPALVSASIRDRTLSPLRRNPSAGPSLRTPSNLAMSNSKPLSRSMSRPESNTAFSQTLSKFRTLAAQNPQEGSQASTEVTQRAIAGIFIPGSLREQAVRNLSKSRERGNAAGSMSRSASKSDTGNRKVS